MRTVRFIFLPTIVAALPTTGGCKAHQNADPAAPASAKTPRVIDVRKETYSEETALRVQQSAVAVVQGPTPLVHIFDVAGPIRVVDLTSGARLLSVTVAARSLVRIDDRHGVIVGADNLYPGPLPPGHQYGIYVEPTTPNVMRHDIGPPGDKPLQPKYLDSRCKGISP